MADFYRINTSSLWQSQSGNAIIALANKASSGKVVKIYSVGVNVNTALGPATNFANLFGLYRTTAISGGDEVSIYKLDSSNPDVPSGISVLTGGSITSSDWDNGNYIKRFAYHQSLSLAANGLAKIMGSGIIGNNSQIQYSENVSSSVPITLVQDEGISIMPIASLVRISCYYRIDCTFLVTISSVDYTYYASAVVSCTSTDTAMFSIFNSSTDNIKILRINMSEMGDATTPYFMLVPIQGIHPQSVGDPVRQCPILKMDSTASNPTSYVDCYLDVPVAPFGVPDSYLSEASVSNPKGMSYLQIKDFIGPIYQVQFAELYTNTFTDGLLTTIACANKRKEANNLWKGTTPIILNEGEGVAICSSAENILAATNMIFLTSYGSYNFTVDFSIEDISYELNITGLKPNSEVRIYISGSTTELGGIENSGTSFSWNFTYEPDFYVDIVVMNLQYQHYRINNLLLENADMSILVQQIIDRNYLNS